MTRPLTVRHEFIDYVPDDLELDTIYVSIMFDTVVHSCLCGCGGRVVTPLSPAEWQMTYDGESITLMPSVGNWSFACQSHYVIRNNRVRWAAGFSKKHIAEVRERDRRTLEAHMEPEASAEPEVGREAAHPRLRRRLLAMFRGLPVDSDAEAPTGKSGSR